MTEATNQYARGAAALAAMLAWGAPGLAAAQQQPNQAPVQGLYANASGAMRYATPDGAVRFVFDRSLGRVALIRFENDPEVHVLRPVMAARGVEIYRTEDGAVELRVAANGVEPSAPYHVPGKNRRHEHDCQHHKKGIGYGKIGRSSERGDCIRHSAHGRVADGKFKR